MQKDEAKTHLWHFNSNVDDPAHILRAAHAGLCRPAADKCDLTWRHAGDRPGDVFYRFWQTVRHAYAEEAFLESSCSGKRGRRFPFRELEECSVQAQEKCI